MMYNTYVMAVIYYTCYDNEDLSLSEVTVLEHALGRKLLAHGLSVLSGTAVSEKNLEPLISFSENGKPFFPSFPDIFFNITHCSQLAACVFADRPVGIDAEIPGYYAPVLIDKALTLSEKHFLENTDSKAFSKNELFWRFWTLKEAYVKRSGTGVDTDLKAFSFNFDHDLILCSDPDVYCYQTRLSGGQILSVCMDPPPEEITLIPVVFS